MTLAAQFVAGVLIGLPAAVVGLVFGIPGMATAIVVVGLISLVPRLPMLMGGGLVGVGATWFALFDNQALRCAQADACGRTPIDMTPWLAFSGATLIVGALVCIYAARRARRT
jgi:hypothetical protein